MEDVLQEIKAERERQQIIEGFDNKHDDDHDAGELAGAGAAYALNASCVLYPANGTPIEDPRAVGWCWDMAWWKPKDARTDLIRAAALIVAEIERIDRQFLRTA